MSRATASIQRQILEIDPSAEIDTGGMFWFQVPQVPGQPARSAKPFTWNGLDWTGGLILERLLWIGFAVLIALAASIPFDRFDPSRRRASAKASQNQPVILEKEPEKPVKVVHLSALAQQSLHGRFFSVLGAELRLMFKGQKIAWYLIALGLLVGLSLSPLEIMATYLFPLACLWPVLLWSGMGGREKQHQTWGLVLSVAQPLRRQLPALWLAGVLVGLATTGASGIRFGLAGQWEHVLAWGIGILFVPSFALTLGVWSGGSKLFEVSYVVLWYLGILQHIPVFDFFGLTDLALASGMPMWYTLLTILLVGLAIAGRWRQLQS